MLFSIIMPVYNCKNYIKNSIKSVIDQSCEDWQLVIVDDGSTDGSQNICEEYANSDSRIKVVHISNGGPSIARNTALKYIEGEYVLFLDSDDLLEESALVYLKDIIDNNEPDLVIYNYYNDKFENGNIINSFNRTIKDEVYSSNDKFKSDYIELDGLYMTYPIWNKLYKRELITNSKAAFPENVSVAEDLVFNLKIYKNVNKIITVNKKLYHYVFRPTGSLSQNFDVNRLEKYKVVYNEATNFFKDWLPEAVNNMSNNYIYEISIFINNMFNKGVKLPFNKKRENIRQIIDDDMVLECLKNVKCTNKRNKIICFLLKHRMINMLLLIGKISRIGKR